MSLFRVGIFVVQQIKSDNLTLEDEYFTVFRSYNHPIFDGFHYIVRGLDYRLDAIVCT